MADADTSDFEQFITNRIDFTTGPPLIGDTGDFEQWVVDRIDFAEYVESQVPTRIPRPPAAYNTLMIY